MKINLDKQELQEAIAQYLGTEYKVASVKALVKRNGSEGFNIEVDCTRNESTTITSCDSEEVQCTPNSASLFGANE